jgi:hypothetical protein
MGANRQSEERGEERRRREGRKPEMKVKSDIRTSHAHISTIHSMNSIEIGDYCCARQNERKTISKFASIR